MCKKNEDVYWINVAHEYQPLSDKLFGFWELWGIT
jgi:hypothetical protein